MGEGRTGFHQLCTCTQSFQSNAIVPESGSDATSVIVGAAMCALVWHEGLPPDKIVAASPDAGHCTDLGLCSALEAARVC